MSVKKKGRTPWDFAMYVCMYVYICIYVKARNGNWEKREANPMQVNNVCEEGTVSRVPSKLRSSMGGHMFFFFFFFFFFFTMPSCLSLFFTRLSFFIRRVAVPYSYPCMIHTHLSPSPTPSISAEAHTDKQTISRDGGSHGDEMEIYTYTYHL